MNPFIQLLRRHPASWAAVLMHARKHWRGAQGGELMPTVKGHPNAKAEGSEVAPCLADQEMPQNEEAGGIDQEQQARGCDSDGDRDPNPPAQ